MEHQVPVPLPARLVRQALREPGLLARCVPGLTVDGPEPGVPQPDGPGSGGPGRADGTVSGRLRLRVGGASITYRGEFAVAPDGGGGDGGGGDGGGGDGGGGDGAVSVTAEAREVRGAGQVSLALRVAVEEGPAGSGTAVLVVTGKVAVQGRLAEADPAAAAAAGQRLLERTAAALAAEHAAGDPAAGDPSGDGSAGAAAPEDRAGDAGDVDDPAADGPEEPAEAAGTVDARLEELEELGELEGLEDPDAPGAAPLPDHGALPLPGDPLPGDPLPGGRAAARGADGADPLDGPVRRSIVGRSAEEVDHAPPRGRYAPALPARGARGRVAARRPGADRGPATPVAAPDADRSLLPWVIGGGAAVVGGAVALARVLRRR
ncbi:hypothetical protein LO771_24025 [Streptacidiphilus sp. ASG 303]|uniref:hypothetical protein n=1 Tax=Streptacidiphilus sp. ASG 303 TaxID=2896847 RepID=UPI001E5A81A6|nr:hypothetical protein [Streptacidiphilus sp. ASG 303]MCD0485371.1 hypothetical protein [Streptacidiphilus sp. ASG 303]